MMIADITLAAFTFCNSLRFAAYVPQITRAIRDQSGAETISFGTWSLFLISDASTMAYALVNNEDWGLAFMFLGNVIGCSAILYCGLEAFTLSQLDDTGGAGILRAPSILKPLALELTPARHPPVQPHHEFGQEHVSIFDDHGAEPADGGEKLRHDDADDRQADREPDPSHDEGDRRRQDDLQENLPLGRAIGAADFQHRAAHIADAGIGVDGDREDRDRDQGADFANEFQAGPQDDQRNESDAWDGVERVDEGVEHVFQRAPLRHDDAERNSDHYGKRHADRERP